MDALSWIATHLRLKKFAVLRWREKLVQSPLTTTIWYCKGILEIFCWKVQNTLLFLSAKFCSASLEVAIPNFYYGCAWLENRDTALSEKSLPNCFFLKGYPETSLKSIIQIFLICNQIRGKKSFCFSELLIRTRLIQSERLLRETDLPISVVPGKTVLEIQPIFFRAFRKHFHMPPANYWRTKESGKENESDQKF